MPSISNKELFQGKEYREWSTRNDLVEDEIFVFDRYLNPNLKTIEAGSGGGRITYSLKKMGFTSLHGFDFVPEFVEAAKAKDPTHSISFEVQDATRLAYPDNSFEQLLYLGQMISCQGTTEEQLKVTQEAYRIAKPGALLLISFMSMDSRLARPLHAAYTAYLRAFRALRGCNKPLQLQPWLKHGGKTNFGAFKDASPYLYYFKLSEIGDLIKRPGFEIVEIGSTYQISHHESMCQNIAELSMRPIYGAIFAACRKPIYIGKR
ncbi:MAG: class I SAM-dependent methyltransferase [Armatimonadetes bacterium]|nr:class I SAM-dependent methyltransferase [Armatimonadota bacterium]